MFKISLHDLIQAQEYRKLFINKGFLRKQLYLTSSNTKVANSGMTEDSVSIVRSYIGLKGLVQRMIQSINQSCVLW